MWPCEHSSSCSVHVKQSIFFLFLSKIIRSSCNLHNFTHLITVPVGLSLCLCLPPTSFFWGIILSLGQLMPPLIQPERLSVQGREMDTEVVPSFSVLIMTTYEGCMVVHGTEKVEKPNSLMLYDIRVTLLAF